MGVENILESLSNKVVEIHKGHYPKDILLDLGKAGLYQPFLKNGENGLFQAIGNIAKVSQICGNTGFCVWCQNALIWYLFNAKNKNERIKELFKKASNGEILGGTGLSNPMKAFVGIEKHKIKGKKVSNGIALSGTLPWVSNIEKGHYFGAIVEMEYSSEFSLVLIECNENAKLSHSVSFCALEGSGTLAVCLDNYIVPSEDILVPDFKESLLEIIPAFVILQGGIALGLIDSAIENCTKNLNIKGGINSYLSSLDDFVERRNNLVERTQNLAKTPYLKTKEYFRSALELKKDFIDLALELANQNMLFLGTKGYLQDSLASKLLLESYFVAIVTPSLKHINKILQS